MSSKLATPPKHIFIPPGTYSGQEVGSAITLTESHCVHHLVTVSRVRQGEKLQMVDPTHPQTLLLGTLDHVDKKSLSLTLDSITQAPPSPLPTITLAVALIKEQRWDWLLQKAAELDASKIIPLLSERTVIHPKDGEAKRARWQTIVQMAAEQSESLFLPTVEIPIPLSQWIEHAQNSPNSKHLLLEAREIPGILPLRAILAPQERIPITVTLGPEGGWSARELEQMLGPEGPFTPVTLGAKILRTETAAIAALSAFHYVYTPD